MASTRSLVTSLFGPSRSVAEGSMRPTTGRPAMAAAPVNRCVPIGTMPLSVSTPSRFWRSRLKCCTARSVNSGRLPPLTIVSPSAVTSSPAGRAVVAEIA